MKKEIKVVLKNSYMGDDIIRYIEELEKENALLEAKYNKALSDLVHESKKRSDLEKALYKTCIELEKYTGSCPLDCYGYEVKRGCEIQCSELENLDCTICWKEWSFQNVD